MHTSSARKTVYRYSYNSLCQTCAIQPQLVRGHNSPAGHLVMFVLQSFVRFKNRLRNHSLVMLCCVTNSKNTIVSLYLIVLIVLTVVVTLVAEFLMMVVGMEW